MRRCQQCKKHTVAIFNTGWMKLCAECMKKFLRF